MCCSPNNQKYFSRYIHAQNISGWTYLSVTMTYFQGYEHPSWIMNVSFTMVTFQPINVYLSKLIGFCISTVFWMRLNISDLDLLSESCRCISCVMIFSLSMTVFQSIKISLNLTCISTLSWTGIAHL